MVDVPCGRAARGAALLIGLSLCGIAAAAAPAAPKSPPEPITKDELTPASMRGSKNQKGPLRPSFRAPP